MSRVPPLPATRRAPGAWDRLLDSMPVAFTLLFAVVLIIAGRPVPNDNDAVYLLRLFQGAHPGFLGHDWTFRHGASEHFWFNALLSPLTRFVPLVAIAWGGRLLTWAAVLWGVLALARRLGIRPGFAVPPLAVWLGTHMGVVAGCWMVGSFEAKAVGYPLLVWSLVAALSGHPGRSGILAGVSVVFHPAVGVWGGLATLVGLIASLPRPRDLLRFLVPAGVLGLVGIVPVLGLAFPGSPATRADLEFLVHVGMPFHLDPTSWPRRDIATLVLIVAANAVFLTLPTMEPAVRRCLRGFEWTLAAVFLAGFLAFALGAYRLLEYYPFRLLPVFAPLLFFLFVARTLTEPTGARVATPWLLACMLVPAMLGLPAQIDRETKWLRGLGIPAEEADLTAALRWVQTHTHPEDVLIAPPWRKDTWWIARRAQIASIDVSVYDDLPGWRERILALYGDPDRIGARQLLKPRYHRLTEAQVLALRDSFGGTVLITGGDYPFELIHENGAYRVYRLPPRAAP